MSKIDSINDLLEPFRSAGQVPRVRRSQLPELQAENITAEMLAAHGVEIVDDQTFETDDDIVLVCVSSARYFRSDNVFTTCANCGGGIQHRPDVPPRVSKALLPVRPTRRITKTWRRLATHFALASA